MKLMKIFVKILLVFLIIIFVIAGAILINGHYFTNKKDKDNNSHINWMDRIRDDVKINEIIIPGSHDAGTYNMTYLGRTQGYSIKDQLIMGTRYFDLRVNKTDDDYYLYHEFFDGEKFLDALIDLKDFIQENPSELLILDFQHFKNNSEDDVIKLIEKYLVKEDLVVKNQTLDSDLKYVSELTLGKVRGKCLILFGHHDELTNEVDYLFSRNNDNCDKLNQSLNSCYISEYQKMSSKKFIEIGLTYYYQQIQDKIKTENYKGLFVLQGQLTDGYLIFGPYSREKQHHKNMDKFINNLINNQEYLQLTNIIMRDFLTDEKCELIISLNSYKGNYK